MKAIVIALALAAPLAAFAQAAAVQPDSGHHARLYERYCERLRESPQAYAQFVNRMRLVTGYSATDFATYDGSAPTIATCRENAQKLAAATAQAAERPRR